MTKWWLDHFVKGFHLAMDIIETLETSEIDIMMSIQIHSLMAKIPKRTPQGESLTALTMELFRVSGLMLNAGDRLTSHLGLTGARWQILGAVFRADQPQPVAGLARILGANRQNVQRIANDLQLLGLLNFEPNPSHRRAQLVVLTKKGRTVYESAMALQAPWVNTLSDGLTMEDLAAFQRVLLFLREKLEMDGQRAGV